MITDFRVDPKLPRHRKYKRLKRVLGTSPMEHLVCLWAAVAEQIPNGLLSGWTEQDIEDAAEWDGEEGVFCRAIMDCGFLDKTGDGFYPHDWHEHQPWVVGAKERRERARLAGKASAAARKGKFGTPQPSNSPRTGSSKPVPNEPEQPVRTFDRTPSPSPIPSRFNDFSNEMSGKDEIMDRVIEIYGGRKSVKTIPITRGKRSGKIQERVDYLFLGQVFP